MRQQFYKMRFLFIQCLCAYLVVPSFRCCPLSEVPQELKAHISTSIIPNAALGPESSASNTRIDIDNTTVSEQSRSILIKRGQRFKRSNQKPLETNASVAASKTPRTPTPSDKKNSRRRETTQQPFSAPTLDVAQPDVAAVGDGIKIIKDRVGREKQFFIEQSDSYPEDKIRRLLEQTSSELIELLNVTRPLPGQDMSLTERTAWNYDYGESQAPKEVKLCPSSVRYIQPKEALKDGVMVYVANDERFKQLIETEVCAAPDEECPYLRDSVPYGMRSFCHQKYAYKKMLYLDGERLATDLFRYQSCCSCRLRYVDTSNDLRSSQTSPLRSNSEKDPSKELSADSTSSMIDVNGTSSDAPESDRLPQTATPAKMVSNQQSGASRVRLPKALIHGAQEQVWSQQRTPSTRERQSKNVPSPSTDQTRISHQTKPSSTSAPRLSSSTHTIILQDDGVYKSDG